MFDANVGVGKAVTTNIQLTGVDVGNYTLIQPVGITVNIITPLVDMVRVESGWFMFGRCAQNSPTGGTHTEVNSFYIGKYQVTQDEWREVMTDNLNGINASPSGFSSGPVAGDVQGRRPVESVSWYDVLVFCNRLSMREGLEPAYSINGSTNPNDWATSQSAIWDTVIIVDGSNGYRLPTERQWEFAAKGGTQLANYTGAATDTYFIYSGSDNVDLVAWHYGNSPSGTREVGRLDANELGLHDMSGNVWEWCWDLVGVNRVLRGGSWISEASFARSAGRDFYWPYGRGYDDGFRLVRP
jgi:formylglycine-generating enzyme required for sulfatase activity